MKLVVVRLNCTKIEILVCEILLATYILSESNLEPPLNINAPEFRPGQT